MKTNIDGTIDVQVTLTVQVDPHAWARTMMDTHPDEVLQREVRRDVKRQVRNHIAEWPMSQATYGDEDDPVPVGDVSARGLYDDRPPAHIPDAAPRR